MEIIYKAFDGKIFYNEYDCCEYEEEKQLERYQKDIRILDSKGNIMPLTFENLEKTFCLNIKREECIKWLSGQSIIYPNETGTYYYDDYTDEWEKLDEKIDELKKELSFFTDMKEKLEG